jgi:hypothetical protein
MKWALVVFFEDANQGKMLPYFQGKIESLLTMEGFEGIPLMIRN